ncbi:MAG: undecaprenyl-diphosphate phosphatase, partial [Clostridia bacterium]|nr:undecaprenyl-diphosphate phosphatase [Clostridia bacterium]
AGLEFKDVVSEGASFETVPMLIGMLVAAVVGYFSLKLVGKIVRSGAFRYFGYYCFAIGLVTIGMGIYETVSGNLISSLIG